MFGKSSHREHFSNTVFVGMKALCENFATNLVFVGKVLPMGTSMNCLVSGVTENSIRAD